MKTTDMSKDFAEARARGEALLRDADLRDVNGQPISFDAVRERVRGYGTETPPVGELAWLARYETALAAANERAERAEAALEEERLQHSHTAAAVEEYREGFTKRMQEIATLRTRAEQAEAKMRAAALELENAPVPSGEHWLMTSRARNRVLSLLETHAAGGGNAAESNRDAAITRAEQAESAHARHAADRSREVTELHRAHERALRRAERAEADLTAARALLREAMRYLPRYVPIGNELRARIEAHIGRSE